MSVAIVGVDLAKSIFHKDDNEPLNRWIHHQMGQKHPKEHLTNWPN